MLPLLVLLVGGATSAWTSAPYASLEGGVALPDTRLARLRGSVSSRDVPGWIAGFGGGVEIPVSRRAALDAFLGASWHAAGLEVHQTVEGSDSAVGASIVARRVIRFHLEPRVVDLGLGAVWHPSRHLSLRGRLLVALPCGGTWSTSQDERVETRCAPGSDCSDTTATRHVVDETSIEDQLAEADDRPNSVLNLQVQCLWRVAQRWRITVGAAIPLNDYVNTLGNHVSWVRTTAGLECAFGASRPDAGARRRGDQAPPKPPQPIPPQDVVDRLHLHSFGAIPKW